MILSIIMLISTTSMSAQVNDVPSLGLSEHREMRGQLDLRVAGEMLHAFIIAARSREGHSVKYHLQQTEDPRAVAIGLTILLGPFGAHRIYLGTHELVPVFYTLTLGGGLGVVPVIDLLHLIFKRDISPYVNNPKVLMWGGK